MDQDFIDKQISNLAEVYAGDNIVCDKGVDTKELDIYADACVDTKEFIIMVN